jgi:hypothetical protein
MAVRRGTIVSGLLCFVMVVAGGTTPARAASAGWEQLPDLDVFVGVHPNDAAAWGAGFIVVGSEPAVFEEEYGAPSYPVVLRSSDGRGWERFGFEAPDGSRPWATLNSVAIRGSRIVVGGLLQTVYDPIDGPRYQAAIWWSDDGATWTPASVPDLEGDAATIGTMVATADGFVTASGYIEEPTFLRSSDGESWVLADRDPADIPGGGFVERLTAASDRIIAYGLGGEADGCRPGFWWSVNGSRWTAATSLSTFTGCPENGVAGALFRTPQRWLATITMSDGRTEDHPVIASLDGTEWHRTVEPGDLDSLGLVRVAPAPGGYLGFGSEWPLGRDEIRAWTSTDGSGWWELPLSVRDPEDTNFWFITLAVGPEAALAIGRYRSDVTPLAASTTVFIREAVVGAAPGPVPTPPPTDTGPSVNWTEGEGLVATLAWALLGAVALLIALLYAARRTRRASTPTAAHPPHPA